MIGTNNPLNLRYDAKNRWLGQTGFFKGFCCFRDVKYCIRAVAYLLFKSYPRVGVRTYADIIKRYAPPSENDTLSYTRYICKQMDCLPFDIPCTTSDVAKLIHYMWIMESGKNSSLFDLNQVDYIESIIKRYNLHF